MDCQPKIVNLQPALTIAKRLSSKKAIKNDLAPLKRAKPDPYAKNLKEKLLTSSVNSQIGFSSEQTNQYQLAGQDACSDEGLHSEAQVVSSKSGIQKSELSNFNEGDLECEDDDSEKRRERR